MKKRLALLLSIILLTGCQAKETSTEMAEVDNNGLTTTVSMTESAIETAISEPTDEEIAEKEITTNIEDFFTLLKDGNWEKSQEYLNTDYDYLRKTIFSIDDEATLKKHYSLFDATVENIEIDGDNAVVKLSIKHPDIQQILDERRSVISYEMEQDATEKAMYELLNSSSLRYETDTAYLTIKKKKNNWEILTDNYFALAIDYGKTSDLSIQILTENEKKRQKMEEYINSNVELLDYNIGLCSSYNKEDVPGITRLSIKNNGDKDIESVTVIVEFLDNSNNVVFKEDMTVIGSLFNDPIKSGYSWKMEDGKFFEIENVPDEVNIQKANLYISEITLTETKESSNLSPEKEYIRDFIELTSAKVEMCSSYNKKCPGLRDVSVKNNGEKDIKSLTVTVYFQDDEGRDIAENSFMVIGNLFDYSDGLKANYSWALENDRFYEIKNLADEVDISRYRVEITEITFE